MPDGITSARYWEVVNVGCFAQTQRKTRSKVRAWPWQQDMFTMVIFLYVSVISRACRFCQDIQDSHVVVKAAGIWVNRCLASFEHGSLLKKTTTSILLLGLLKQLC